MLARKLLMVSIGGGAFIVPSFTGSYAVFGDEKKGYIELYSSGTLTFDGNSTVDVFILGSGLKGGSGTQITGYPATIVTEKGGTGGSGGKGAVYTGIKVLGSYDITIAAACSSTSTANASSAFGNSVNTKGASGGSGSNDANGGGGATGISVPFEDSANFPYTYGGGGGGGGGSYTDGSTTKSYQPGSGGSIGGGKGALVSAAVAGTANTGGGGGGGKGSSSRRVGADGGSGLVIVRWGY